MLFDLVICMWFVLGPVMLVMTAMVFWPAFLCGALLVVSYQTIQACLVGRWTVVALSTRCGAARTQWLLLDAGIDYVECRMELWTLLLALSVLGGLALIACDMFSGGSTGQVVSRAACSLADRTTMWAFRLGAFRYRKWPALRR